MIYASSVKEKFNVPNLPFVAGDFAHQWKNENIEICTPVVNAIRDVCNSYSSGRFVETDRLLSNVQELNYSIFGGNDTIHFFKKIYIYIGTTLF